MTDEPFAQRLRTDPEFRARFEQDPKRMLREAGIHVNDEHDVEIIELDPTKHYVIISPLSGEISEAEMEGVVAGYGAQDVYLTGSQITFFK